MAQATLLDHWLDLWEGKASTPGAADLESFITIHCQEASPDLIDQFRTKVAALKRVNALVRAADWTSAPEETRAPDVCQAEPLRLTAGAEPIRGYRLEAFLGRGGFGEVWRASAPGDRKVALKFVSLEEKRLGGKEQRAVLLMKSVCHPGLLSIHGAWARHGYLIIAMELAERTLKDRLREAQAEGHEGIPALELHRYFRDFAAALDYLHAQRVFDGVNISEHLQHRDIKPANLMLQGQHAKITDFGLVHCLSDSVTNHSGGCTVDYAAPEFFDQKLTRHSDQYSLAVTYCHLRGGRLPFQGSQAQILFSHIHREPDLTMLPAGERPAVARALEKVHDRRWPCCLDFVEGVIEGRNPPLSPLEVYLIAEVVLPECRPAEPSRPSRGLRERMRALLRRIIHPSR